MLPEDNGYIFQMPPEWPPINGCVRLVAESSPSGEWRDNRHPRQLDDTALDGVHERVVAYRPRKERALSIT